MAVRFGVNAGADTGTAGDDNLAGTSGNDVFNLSQGGNDTANGKDGKDLFKLKGTFNALDSLNGAGGQDTLVLEGDYLGGVTCLASTMTGIESIKLVQGFDYTLTLDNANVSAGSGLTISAKQLGAGDVLNFNGVATRSGVSTATLERYWGSRIDMVVDAVRVGEGTDAPLRYVRAGLRC